MEKMDHVDSSFWEFKGQGEYSDTKFLMSTPIPVICILITYLWFVLKFGPELMKNRKPFVLDRILVVYNFVQVLVCCGLVLMGVPGVIDFGLYHSKCYSEYEHLGRQITDGAHLYFLLKVVELLDTIFFVLRKKQNQVSFLHVYHHTLMVFSTWCVVKYTTTDSVVFIGMINSLVHIIMYLYYGLSVFPSLTKYLWWKKYITIFQLIQFCLMFIHIVISHFFSECKPNYVLMFAICSNTMLFFYLFGDFYIKSYTGKTKASLEKKVETTSNSNGEEKSGLNFIINHHKLAAKIN